MKKLLLITLLVSAINNINAQSIGVGTNTPNNSSMLDISSTSKGLLIPRMTTAQRTAIASPASGLMVYDITTNSFWYYNNSAWTNLSASGGGEPFSFPLDTTLALPGAAFRIINYGTGIQGGSINGTGVLANSTSGAGLNAFSANNYGIIANSSARSAIYAYNNNAYPAIDAINSSSSGVAINANAPNYHAIKGVTGGTGKSGIWGETTGLGGNGVYGTAGSNSGYGVHGSSMIGTGVYGFSNTGTGVKALSNSGLALEVNGNMKIAGGNTNPVNGAILRSDASGNAVWQKTKVGFRARGVNSSYLGMADNTPTKVHWATEEYDYDNNYALHVGTNPVASSSVFTVPVSGLYHFDARIMFSSVDQSTIQGGGLNLIIKRGGNVIEVYTGSAVQDHNMPELATASLSTDVKLLAGDIIYILVNFYNDSNTSGQMDGLRDLNFFNGHLVFAD